MLVDAAAAAAYRNVSNAISVALCQQQLTPSAALFQTASMVSAASQQQQQLNQQRMALNNLTQLISNQSAVHALVSPPAARLGAMIQVSQAPPITLPAPAPTVPPPLADVLVQRVAFCMRLHIGLPF